MAASLEELPDFFKRNSKTEEAQYHKGKVHSVGWNCDGRKLASGSTDRTVCTYSIDRERLVCLMLVHSSSSSSSCKLVVMTAVVGSSSSLNYYY